MKTIRRKTMRLDFDLAEPCGQTYTVSTGEQKLAVVSYDQVGDTIFVFRLDVEPYLDGFDIGSRILDALLAEDTVKRVQIISSLFMAGYYTDAGFACDPDHILLTKTKNDL